MDIATIMALLSAFPLLKGLFGETPDLEKIMGQQRTKRQAEMRVPIKAQHARARRKVISRWGTSGLISGRGQRAEERKVGRDYGDLLSRVMLSAGAQGEAMGTTMFQSELAKVLGERGAWSQLGGLMLTPLAMKLGTQWAQPKETPQAAPQDDIAEILRALGLATPLGMGESQEALQYILPYLLQGLGR